MRDHIIKEAVSWLRTPWHHRAMVKGAGADCVFFLVGVFNAVGLTRIIDADVPYYPADIMLNRSEETVLDVISKYADEIMDPLPGDVVLFKFGRIYSHAGILLGGTRIVHASRPEGMVTLGDMNQGELQPRLRKFFRMRGL